MQSFLLVFSTAASKTEARRIASILLKKHLAACINITSPIESHYWWKGKKEKGREVLLLIKTKAALFAPLERTIREVHSYSVPEIIAVPINKGNRRYFAWISGVVRV